MNILGIEMGERECNVGVRGVWIGVFFGCGGGMSGAGCCVFVCVSACDDGCLFFAFFSPSPVMSSLSLLLFKFVVVSISSCFSSGICFFVFFLFAEMGDFMPLFVSAGDFVDTVASLVSAGVLTVVVSL